MEFKQDYTTARDDGVTAWCSGTYMLEVIDGRLVHVTLEGPGRWMRLTDPRAQLTMNWFADSLGLGMVLAAAIMEKLRPVEDPLPPSFLSLGYKPDYDYVQGLMEINHKVAEALSGNIRMLLDG